jgi:hypothetical protein
MNGKEVWVGKRLKKWSEKVKISDQKSSIGLNGHQPGVRN